ncbi:DUF1254 domain-containing protein [Pusillimonas sp.]|uniref:DUF1254 domain-containing protein n=1 Tax=Pusillimonas sp. TaxID=3040095 RepID=UPI0037CB7649
MRLLSFIFLLFTLVGCSSGSGTDTDTDTDSLRANAKDAYTYGYPLVLMERTRQVSTAVPGTEGSRAPMNQYAHIKTFPDPDFKDVVSPNVDTLYSIAWLDLSSEPIVVAVPDARNYAPTGADARYYLLQMLDAWTNVFDSPGLRTRGPQARDFLLSGPDWNGEIPAGLEHIPSPTALVWITGRTQVIDDADLPNVHAFQEQLKLIPLSNWGTAYTPPTNVPVEEGIDFSTPPASQVDKLSAQEFFAELSLLMSRNPAATYDAAILERLATMGFVPGEPFDLSSLPRAQAAAIEAGYRIGRERLLQLASRSGADPVNGWTVLTSEIGSYKNNYDMRAITALVGLGANLPEDAVYPRTAIDGTGEPLSSQHQYTLSFEAGKWPPANAFWSLTLYDSDQALVVNPIDRYAIGSRDGLVQNSDGSLTIYIQSDAPAGAMQNNWLPAPQDKEQPFNLVMRVYWPKNEMLNGDWVVPPVVKTSK